MRGGILTRNPPTKATSSLRRFRTKVMRLISLRRRASCSRSNAWRRRWLEVKPGAQGGGIHTVVALQERCRR